jgi:hypothetical protein
VRAAQSAGFPVSLIHEGGSQFALAFDRNERRIRLAPPGRFLDSGVNLA